MIKSKKRVIFCIFILIVLVGLFFNLGKFLVIGDNSAKSDAIIVLSGDRGERIEKAADPFHKGYGHYFVISGGSIYNDITAAQLMKDHAIKLGVPEKSIILEN
jgi:uncharacterized SAM-binding protein YcdF (DUF218 family)